MSAAHAHGSACDTAEWACLLREHFVALDVVDSGADEFEGEVDAWSLAHLHLARVRSKPQVIERSSSLVRTDHRAYLQVGLVRAGHAVVAQDGREAVLGPGDFVVYETTRPFTWALRPGDEAPVWQLDVFTWPRHSIALSEADSHRLTATAMDGSAGLSGIISRMLRDLMTERPVLRAPQSAALADEVGDLLAVLTSSVLPVDEHHRDAALRARIDAYLDEHLDDPDLDPEMVARAHAVSVRQLHRLFADRDLTVARTIRSRRLEQCRRDLVAAGAHGRSVTEIARRWGFPDLGVFGRAFRETYGVSPRAYRAAATTRRTS